MARVITDFKKQEPSYETFTNEEEHPDKIKYVNKLSKDGYTLEDAVERLGFGRFQIMVGCMSGFAWVADGMEIMVLSILGPVLLCEWNLQTWEEALITTVVFIGFLIGSPVFGWLSDKYGRRKGLIVSTVWICYYGIVSAASPSLVWLLVLRLLVGFGVGGGPQAITYYSEFLPNKMRGRLIILVEVFWAIGGMLEVVLAIIILEPFGWRWWLVASALPTALFLVFCYFLPESPRYEVVTGNPEKAQAIFTKAAKMNGTALPPGKLLPEKRVPRGRPQDLVISEFRLTSGLLSFLWFVAAFSYYGIILFTTGLIRSGSTCSAAVGAEAEENVCSIQCDSLNMEDYQDLLWTAAAELPGLLLTAVLVDLLGRKKTMIMEFLVFGVFCFILFICMNRIPMLIMLFIARAFISSAFQVLYVYTPEVYPTQIRALSVGFGSAFGRIGAIITPYIAEVLLEKSLRMALGVYATLGVLAAFVAFVLPIETKGKDMKKVGSFHQQ